MKYAWKYPDPFSLKSHHGEDKPKGQLGVQGLIE